MCKWGTYVEMPLNVWVNMPDYPMEFELKDRYIDACLAPLIYKLNANNVITLNCCCGHNQNKIYSESKGIVEPSIIIAPESCLYSDALGYYAVMGNTFATIYLD